MCAIIKLLIFCFSFQVSYGATSLLLSDKSIYSTLFRTCPSEKQFTASLASLIAYFKWSCVNIISSKDTLNRGVIGSLKRNLKKHNVCVALHEVVAQSEIPRVVSAIKARKSVSVSVLLGNKDFVADILEEVQKNNLTETKRVWIGTDTRNDRFQLANSYGDVINGMLAMSVPEEDLGEFKVRASHLSRNISGAYCAWLKKDSHWPAFCELHSEDNVVGLQALSLAKSAYVMNAALAIIQALKHVTRCGVQSSGLSCLEGNFTLQHVRQGVLGNLEKNSFNNNRNISVGFDTNRELNAEYEILNFRASNNETLTPFRVGKWTRDKRLAMNEGDIQWPGNESKPPYSRCRERCPLGTFTIYGFGACWWSCQNCPHGTYNSNYTATLCKVCPGDQMTNALQSGCVEKPLTIVSFGELITIILLGACGLGLILTLFVLGVIVKYQDTPVVKATNLTFTVLSLVILLAWFVNPVLYIGKPSNAICKARTVSFPVLYTAITAVLLTKTNRLIKIFSAIKKHCFLNNSWYGFLTCALILAQLVLGIIHLLVFPPKATYDYGVDDSLVISCDQNFGFDIASLGYNTLLSIMCTYLAYRSRTLPRAYNEFKWICFSMFSNFSSWLVILIFRHVPPRGKVYVICSILALILGAYSMLFLLFLPKVRVIFFRPEKNTKRAAIESTRRYSIDQASGIGLSPMQGGGSRRKSSPACLALQFMNGSIGKLAVAKNSLGPRRSHGSIIATIKELPEERKSSV